jgi:hypothetical protein
VINKKVSPAFGARGENCANFVTWRKTPTSIIPQGSLDASNVPLLQTAPKIISYEPLHSPRLGRNRRIS